MNRTIPFATELKASPESEPQLGAPKTIFIAPRALRGWYLLLLPENAEVIVSLLHGLAVNDQAHDPEGMKKHLQ